MSDTCTVHLILELLILIMFGEEYNLWNSSCNFFRNPSILSLLGSYILQHRIPKYS
jgi:hypothetical protein